MGRKKKEHNAFIKAIPEETNNDVLSLYSDITSIIETARAKVAVAVNRELVLLYWQIGKRTKDEILGGRRADYGKKILVTLSRQLAARYGQGYSEKNLRRMIQFAEAFPDQEIVVTLSRQLTWSHFIALIPLTRPLQMEFYTEMCRLEGWDVRTLRMKIDSMLFERSAISKKPERLIKKELAELKKNNKLTPDLVFRNPYFLNFLGLDANYSESDLENAILREMEKFLLELGCGFTFVARQKRMIIDGEDHYLDLLFYHRKMKRFVAIELKIGKFKAEYKGQMELYLRWLEKNDIEEDEEAPLGLILCAEGSRETIEYLQLGRSGIHVAEYLTELPPKELLENKLRQAIINARTQLEQETERKEPAKRIAQARRPR
jgi:predicted nuclease of restriction endonuclease-like (RecB) superfamily